MPSNALCYGCDISPEDFNSEISRAFGVDNIIYNWKWGGERLNPYSEIKNDYIAFISIFKEVDHLSEITWEQMIAWISNYLLPKSLERPDFHRNQASLISFIMDSYGYLITSRNITKDMKIKNTLLDYDPMFIVEDFTRPRNIIRRARTSELDECETPNTSGSERREMPQNQSAGSSILNPIDLTIRIPRPTESQNLAQSRIEFESEDEENNNNTDNEDDFCESTNNCDEDFTCADCNCDMNDEFQCAQDALDAEWDREIHAYGNWLCDECARAALEEEERLEEEDRVAEEERQQQQQQQNERPTTPITQEITSNNRSQTPFRELLSPIPHDSNIITSIYDDDNIINNIIDDDREIRIRFSNVINNIIDDNIINDINNDQFINDIINDQDIDIFMI